MEIDVLLRNINFLIDGYARTIVMTLIAYASAFLLAVFLALIRVSPLRLPSLVARVFTDVVRSVPVLMVVFWFYFFIPVVTRRPIDPFTAGTLALIVFYSSYLTEAIRAGIISVPSGQILAAKASGLSYTGSMRLVVLPQALRNMMPTLITLLVSLYLTTSVTYIIGVNEFFRSATFINNREFAPATIFGFVALVYFFTSYGISNLSRKLEVKH